jgi:hypothetical protein
VSWVVASPSEIAFEWVVASVADGEAFTDVQSWNGPAFAESRCFLDRSCMESMKDDT